MEILIYFREIINLLLTILADYKQIAIILIINSIESVMAYFYYPAGQNVGSLPSMQQIPSMRAPSTNKNDMSKILDPKGDRGLPPHKQEDPDMFLHVVEQRPDGIETGARGFRLYHQRADPCGQRGPFHPAGGKKCGPPHGPQYPRGDHKRR